MTPPQLLMVSGSAWGAGKSTLSGGLARALSDRGHAVRLVSEDDFLAMEGFARFERLLGPTDPTTHPADGALLDATRTFAAGLRSGPAPPAVGAPSVVIADALLPGLFWLIGRYDAERVWAFAEQLHSLLLPFRPLLLYLCGDPAALTPRAARERGADWPHPVAARAARWNLPHYPDRPLRTLDDALRFWTWLDTQTLDLLSRWPLDSLVLDAQQPAAALRDTVLADPRITPSPRSAAD